MTRHLGTCPAEHDPGRGAAADLLHLRVQDAYAPLFWLDLEVRADRPLRELDDFLRSTWLECCGHLSRFEIDGARYSVLPDPGERGMDARLGDVLSPGASFTHEYDFGTPTELELRVVGARSGRIGRAPLRLLARNEAPVWTCAECGAPASRIDTETMWGATEARSCAEPAPRRSRTRRRCCRS